MGAIALLIIILWSFGQIHRFLEVDYKSVYFFDNMPYTTIGMVMEPHEYIIFYQNCSCRTCKR
jgi:hypothetical protein